MAGLRVVPCPGGGCSLALCSAPRIPGAHNLARTGSCICCHPGTSRTVDETDVLCNRWPRNAQRTSGTRAPLGRTRIPVNRTALPWCAGGCASPPFLSSWVGPAEVAGVEATSRHLYLSKVGWRVKVGSPAPAGPRSVPGPRSSAVAGRWVAPQLSSATAASVQLVGQAKLLDWASRKAGHRVASAPSEATSRNL